MKVLHKIVYTHQYHTLYIPNFFHHDSHIFLREIIKNIYISHCVKES